MANDQKAEDLLNLALDTPYEMRERSKQLDVGYDRENRTWELIVKYSGNLKEQLLGLPGVEVVELMNEYAILTVPESLVNRIIALPQIEYVEKPKRLYFAVNQGKAASCIPSVQTGELDLSGRGVIVAVIDSGIDYYHGDFRNCLLYTSPCRKRFYSILPTTSCWTGTAGPCFTKIYCSMWIRRTPSTRATSGRLRNSPWISCLRGGSTAAWRSFTNM